MRTERLNIRKFREEDLDDLYELLSDAEVMKYIETPYTREATDIFLHHCGITESPLIYAVEDNDGAFIGYIIYHPYNASSYEIGWIINKSFWGKGYASELTQCLIEDARCKSKNLIIECSPAQAATKHIAFKNHFMFIDNKENLDTYIHLSYADTFQFTEPKIEYAESPGARC